MLWREVIAKTAGYLGTKGVDDAQVAAELLAARLLKTGRGMLGGFADKDANEPFLEAMRRGMARLAAGEPVQYVIGEWDFRRLTLKCDRRALIPRPETEGLVSLVLKSLKGGEVVIDVGTGTGAIILSLAKEAPSPGLLIGTDVSEDAIGLARENAFLAGLEDQVRLLVMDGLEDFDEPQFVDVIVSNPPYIRSADIATLAPQVRSFEPRLALDGGESGLDFYERYLGDALNLLKPGGRVFFEIGNDQGGEVRALMASFGFSSIEIARDLSGQIRYASAVLE